MANTNAPYGFRLWTTTNPSTGAVGVTPGAAAGSSVSASGPLPIASATTLKVGDPIKSSLGLGYLATGTNAIYGICNSPVPNFNETATAKHYPEIIPASDQNIWRCQSTTTTGLTQAYIGVAKNAYRIGGTTSGYQGIDITHTTGGVLGIVALAPGSAFGTYAEVLVVIRRGAFYGAA